jgi:hypothetical protein
MHHTFPSYLHQLHTPSISRHCNLRYFEICTISAIFTQPTADNGELWGWAFFRARRVENVAETYVFESMRWPGSYLLASDMGNGYLTKSYGVVRLAQVILLQLLKTHLLNSGFF